MADSEEEKADNGTPVVTVQDGALLAELEQTVCLDQELRLSSRYLPLSHIRHAPTPVVAENLPTSQYSQVSSLDAPTSAEYLPMPHSTHVAADVCPWCVE